MSLSIVTFANLGKKQNLKTPDILPVIDTFIAKKELKQIICQINKDFYFQNTNSAIPTGLRYTIRILEKSFNIALPRPKMEALFDFFASLKLQNVDIVLFHPALFARTLAVAKKNGNVSIGIAAAAHPLFAKDLYEQEFKILSLTHKTYPEATKDKLIVDDFDYIIAMSDFAKDSYVQSGYSAERIFVAYPDIDITRFTPRNREKKEELFRVLYMAHTQPLKGLHYLLDAWSALNLPKAELVIVGEFSEMPEELKKRYKDAIKQNPSIMWIHDIKIPELEYGKASVFVFPSLSEGFGRVTLEAMASGLPVITTHNARGIVEDGKTGFLVPIRDSRAIKDKIEYLYNHQDIVQQMGKEARRAVENKKPFGEAVFKIYREILKKEQI